MSLNDLEREWQNVEQSVRNSIRSALGLSGLLALLTGIAILVWPTKTAAVVAAIIAIYLAVAGLVNIALGIFARRVGGWSRAGHLLLGVLFVIAAVIALANLGATAAALGTMLGIMVGVLWIFEGVTDLVLIGDAPSKAWTIISSILSVIAGIVLLTSPLWGAAVLWWLLGISLVVIGVAQIVRAFRFGQGA